MTLVIPAGSTQLVTMLITGPAGTDLTSDDVTVFIAVKSDKAPDSPTWAVPDLTQHPAVNQVRVGRLVGPLGGQVLDPGSYRLWARLVDFPEVPWLRTPTYFKVVE